MHSDKQQFYYLLATIIVISVLVFFIFLPFVYPLLLAVVFAVIFQPLYVKIHLYFSKNARLASMFTIFAILFLILAPTLFLGIKISQEAYQVYISLSAENGSGIIMGPMNNFVHYLQNFVPIPQDIYINIGQYSKQVIEWLIQNINNIFSRLANIVIDTFIFLIALYFLLKDGEKFKKIIVDLSPLADSDDIKILEKLELAINSVIKGSLIVALIQGILSTIGLAIFGIPNPTLWGGMATIAALVPGVGTALVFIPATLFTLLGGNLLSALGLFLWGAIVVGLVDNLLRPQLVGTGIQLHPLIVLLSVIGGIGFFGPIGFLLGPLTVSLFFVLLDIYSHLVKRY